MEISSAAQNDRTVEPTRNQTRYMTAELFGAASYMIGLGHTVEGRFDETAARDAFTSVVARHEALRTGFALKDGEATAFIHDEPRFRFIATTLDGSFEAFRTWAVPHVFHDVDVGDPASMVRLLVAVGEDRWRFSVAMHHAITDGFSRGKVNEEFLKKLAGETLDDVSSYYDYQTDLDPDVGSAELLDGFPLSARMPEDGLLSDNDGSQLGHFVERELSYSSADLAALADASESSKFAVFTALYGLGLAAFTGETDVSSFFQTEGRRVLDAPLDVVGPFSNTLPLDLSHSPETTFADYAKDLRTTFRNIVRNEAAPLMETLQETDRAPFVSINKFPSAQPIEAGDLVIGPREFLDRRTEYDLNLVLTEEGDRVFARAFYDAGHLSESRVAAFLDLQDQLFKAALDQPDAPCRTILSLARDGRRVEIAQAETRWEGPERLHEVFLATAGQSPDAAAIVTSEKAITYTELQLQSEAFARGLLAASVHPGDPVAIFAKRGPEMVAAMLGVSMIGGRFALIDAEIPDDRVREMLEICGAKVIIPTENAWPDRLGNVVIARPVSSDAHIAPLNTPGPDDAAYILFTSGTTGRPKAVSHPARTLLRFVQWQSTEIGTTTPVTMMLAGLSHDPIMRDIFLPFFTGGTIAIPSTEEMQSPDDLNKLADLAEVSVLHATPAAARLLTMAQAQTGYRTCQAIFWGGDVVLPSLVSQWRAIAPDAKQWNLYGATETPQAALIAELPECLENHRRVPIGNPMPWTGLRIVDRDGEIVGPGEIGEIVIDLADPVEGVVPWGTEQGLSHVTGDMGFWLPDAGVKFTGRRDHQVKINGHRVEPAEIAAIAANVPGVQAAECVVVESDKAELHLFLVASQSQIEPVVQSELTRYLPAYMLPSRLHFIEQLPLTQNGKADVPALIRMASEAPDLAFEADDQRPLSTEGERAIGSLYARTSGFPVNHVGVTLAELGTDSLGAIETRMELERLGLSLPVGWEWTPVADLAKLLPEATQDTARRPWTIVKLDTFILLRTAAILLIVAQHIGGLEYAVGGSTLLMALAGYTFGVLQLPSIVADGQIGRVWALMLKIIIPLVPISLAVFMVHTLALGRDTNPSAILFYENFSIFLKLITDAPSRHQIIWLWFIHAYLQIFLVIGFVLSFGWVRRQLKSAPWRSLMVAVVIAEGVALAAALGASTVLANYVEVGVAVKRLPTTMLPLFLLGVLAVQAQTLQRQIACAAFLVAHALIVEHFLGGDEYLWVIALPIVVLIPRIPVFQALSAGLILISANALMIYLTHKPFLFAFELGFGHFSGPVSVMSAILFGTFCGMLMRPVFEWFGVNRLARRGMKPNH